MSAALSLFKLNFVFKMSTSCSLQQHMKVKVKVKNKLNVNAIKPHIVYYTDAEALAIRYS